MADETVSRLDIARQRRAELVQQLAPSADRLADLRDAAQQAQDQFVKTSEALQAALDRTADAYAEAKNLERISEQLIIEHRTQMARRDRAAQLYNMAQTAARLGGAA